MYNYMLGPRETKYHDAKPHNMLSMVIGTVLMWYGYFGYNAGSSFGATIQSVYSIMVTNLCASFGAVTWALLDFMQEGTWNGHGVCMGAVTGLTVIVPASGFVHPAASIPFAIVGVVVCRWGHHLKIRSNTVDDVLNVASMHGLGGFVGYFMTVMS
jgi:Amt family ammonium transporter